MPITVLPGDGSGFGVGPDGIQSVGLDAYQSAVAPRTVGIVIVADLRRNVSHRHLAGRLALAHAGGNSGLTGGKSGDDTVLDRRNYLVVRRPNYRYAVLQGGVTVATSVSENPTLRFNSVRSSVTTVSGTFFSSSSQAKNTSDAAVSKADFLKKFLINQVLRINNTAVPTAVSPDSRQKAQ